MSVLLRKFHKIATQSGIAAPFRTVVVAPVDPLLDVLSVGATAAYSLRKLRAAYAGSAIRVRRSSDNAEQDIGFSGNNLDTASLTTFCAGTNGFVTTQYDQSGGVKHVAQATAGTQPKIVASGAILLKNGLPSISYIRSSTQSLQWSGGISNSDPGMLIIYDIEEATFGGSGILSPVTDTGKSGPYGAVGGTVWTGENAADTWDVNASGNHPIMGTTGSGTLQQFYYYRNIGSVGGFPWVGGVVIGQDRGNVGRNWEGHINEVVVFAGDLSGGDRAASYANQKAYWGTA